jgi:hypothetical protein
MYREQLKLRRSRIEDSPELLPNRVQLRGLSRRGLQEVREEQIRGRCAVGSADSQEI